MLMRNTHNPTQAHCDAYTETMSAHMSLHIARHTCPHPCMYTLPCLMHLSVHVSIHTGSLTCIFHACLCTLVCQHCFVTQNRKAGALSHFCNLAALQLAFRCAYRCGPTKINKSTLRLFCSGLVVGFQGVSKQIGTACEAVSSCVLEQCSDGRLGSSKHMESPTRISLADLHLPGRDQAPSHAPCRLMIHKRGERSPRQ